MEKKRRKIMRKEFKAALNQVGKCHDAGSPIDEAYWMGFSEGLVCASAIERDYNLAEINKRIKATKKLVKEGEIAVSEADPSTEIHERQAESLERTKMLFSNLKKVKKKMLKEMERDFF